jgi:predicted porin
MPSLQVVYVTNFKFFQLSGANTMQKKLIALAIAAALAPAAAMADSSNVTLYGVADVSIDSIDNGDSGAVNGVRVTKVSSNASRFGLKGAEDLGNGLKAVFQVESNVSVDGGAGSGTAAGTTLGQRPTFAGLAGDSWGSVTLGIHESAYKTSTRAMDAFGDTIADNRTLMGKTTVGAANAFDSRNSDSIRYDSPNFSGFKVSALYGFNAEANTVSTSDRKNKTVSLSGNYSVAPFNAAVAYQKNDTGTAAAPTDNKAWKAAVGYATSQFGVNGIYEKTTDNLGSGAGGTGHKAYYLSGNYNATANDVIKLAYTKSKDTEDSTTTDRGAKQWSLGVTHSMSKRTSVYALYTKLDNDGNSTSGASYVLTAASSSAGAMTTTGMGSEQSAFSLGMKHVF